MFHYVETFFWKKIKSAKNVTLSENRAIDKSWEESLKYFEEYLCGYSMKFRFKYRVRIYYKYNSQNPIGN